MGNKCKLKLKIIVNDKGNTTLLLHKAKCNHNFVAENQINEQKYERKLKQIIIDWYC